MNTKNPLTQYFRVPKLYVKLPSGGQFYDKQDLDLSVNGEVAVHALTAIDQLLLRTPDALLNGESLIKVVQSCVPGIRNAKQLVEPDINAILLAIKIATNGDTQDMEIKCPSCDHENTYAIHLSHMLETATEVPTDQTVEYEQSLLIHLRPYDFIQRNLTLLNEINYNNAIKMLQNDSDTDDTAKIQSASRTIDQMSRRTFAIVAQSITHITIMSSGEQVTDRQFIEEFLSGITKEQSEAILDKIKELNRSGINTTHDFACAACGHDWQQDIDFDPTSFFD
jgi:hypothetical protein